MGSTASVLAESKRAVEEAETELENVLADIRVAPRAEKTRVSAAIESALVKLRAARTTLTDAERAMTEDESQR